MSKVERIVLWAVIGVLSLWLLALTIMTAGEFAAINRVLGEAPPQAGDGEPTSWWGGDAASPPEATANPPASGGTSGPQVGIAGVRTLSDTVVMTVTVRSSGAGDLLYEPPILVDGDGRLYQVSGDSLESARLAFLDLVTRGQATAQLAFSPAPPNGARLSLILNPGQEPGDIIAPRIEVPVPISQGGTR